MKTYLLIDAMNMFHRCKHITTGDAGTKASLSLHVILNSIKMSWQKFNADHIVFCLDKKSWRSVVYPEYKANRKVKQAAMTKTEREDDELYFATMKLFVNFLRTKTNVTILEADYIEADDFIARWVDKHPNDNHIIISSDSDLHQLLSNNVKIFDGIKGWTISINEVLNENDKPAFSNRTIKEKNEKGKITTKKIKVDVEPPNPEYSLFLKIIRGDSSDNIMSAYPGVREKGSAKKPGIKEAFEDRNSRGYMWNNFMQQEWKKPISIIDDKIEYETVKVKDQYETNKMLIDLRKQPQEILDLMDETIEQSLFKEKVSNVGLYFLKFANQMELSTISKSPTDYAIMLNKHING